jgi:hypothetical protein
MMVRLVILAALIFSIAACGRLGLGNPAKRAETNTELPFRAKLSKGEERAFTVAVTHEGNGVEEVRESVRFEATKYCLLTFGGSDAAWDIDPVTDDWAFAQDGSQLIFAGECTAI